MNDASATTDFGIWIDHLIPEDRSGWHPLVPQFYEYWLSVAPPGRLPGRQHIAPEQMVPMLSRMWMLDVHRDPLRLRFRLYGTALVSSLGREVTGQWLDEARDLGREVECCAKEITGACVEIGPAVRGIDVGTRPAR